MKTSYSRILCTLAGAIAVLGAPAPSFADDSEVFLSTEFAGGDGLRPNVLFILDTSYSMTGIVNAYNPKTNYAGDCPSGYIYWNNDTEGNPPDCATTTQKFSVNNNRCHKAYDEMGDDGWWRGRVQQLNASGSAWQNLADGADRKVECSDDAGTKHGDQPGSQEPSSGQNQYARNGSANSSRWGTSGSGNHVSWNSSMSRSLFSANYINWWKGNGESIAKSRMQIVKDVSTKLIKNLEGVNVGLMRYSDNKGLTSPEDAAQGGMVMYPVSPLTPTSREDLIDEINDMEPTGWTPLSETYYEAFLYLSGKNVYFGQNSRKNSDTAYKSVAASRVGGLITSKTYKSPILYSCQKTFIVYLTDGLPTKDESASSLIEGLEDFAEDGYVPESDGGGGEKCPAKGPQGDSNSSDYDGRCMVNMAAYLRNHDLSGLPGNQGVTTYIVGFGDSIKGSKKYLDQIAAAGGGRAYTQTDAAGLAAAFNEILTDVVEDTNTTFVAPTVAVNAFNRTRTLDSLYVSVFAPTNRVHWPGNVKRYQLVDGVIHGQNGPAVDATGFFAKETKDLFLEGNGGDGYDGADVTHGGAASRLPAWDARKVYTDVTTKKDLTDPDNLFKYGNDALTKTKVGLSATATDTEHQDVIEFALGRDVNNDVNPDQSNFKETRKAMGDPMHSRPAVAIYGGSEDSPTGTVFVTTNDGMLQALDMLTGAELWSFIPEPMLGRLASLQENAVIAQRDYGVDGDIRVFKYDVDGDGTVDTGDRMVVLFGFGRGGAGYYALDVTSRDTPKVLWKKSATDLPMLGQAWSTPVVTRVNIKGWSDEQKHVVIFGAGYDPSQDGTDEDTPYVKDGVGNGVYMLDLDKGDLLWSAGHTDSDADWKHPEMNNSIPSDITVLDINADSFADRLYFGDMGGRIWRLDIWHGQAPADLVSGGILATLGAGHLDDPGEADARRFYYAPDVSLVTPRGSAPYFNIAIGSGYRGHPLNDKIKDRFYSIRDYQPFNRRTNTSFNSPWKPIDEAGLVDVTEDVNLAVPDGSNGWMIRLIEPGEKVLGESVTANGVIFFPSFIPAGADKKNPCLPATQNRTWAVYLDTARPYGLGDSTVPGYDPKTDTDEPSDRYEDSGLGGIAPSTSIVQDEGKTVCLKGVATHKCVAIGDVTRTFWERRQ